MPSPLRRALRRVFPATWQLRAERDAALVAAQTAQAEAAIVQAEARKHAAAQRATVDQLVRIRDQRDRARTARDEKAGKVDELKVRAKGLKVRVGGLKVRVGELKVRVGELKAHADVLRSGRDQARERVAELHERNAEVVKQLAAARELAERARRDRGRAHQSRVAAEEKLKSIRSTSIRLRDQLAEEQLARAREYVVSQGLGEYLLAEHDAEGSSWLPGYARSKSFLSSRRDFVARCRQYAALAPGDRVIDVGCGIGGIAVFLLDVIGDDGSYVGLDVEERAIVACRESITARHPNFRFEVMDVWSGKYNPAGAHRPGEYRFPFDDGSFDFAVLRSLFTHMLPEDVDHYLSELGRLLAPGGRAAVTYFLLNPEALAGLEAGTSQRDYPFVYEHHRLHSEDVPEAAVAIDEEWLLGRYRAHGFEILEVEYGRWHAENAGEAQDIVYAVRV